MENNKLITSTELIFVTENDATENDATETYFKSAADSLLIAISDWPTELSEPNELLAELNLQINDKLTFENISKFLGTLDVETDAWKMESLTSLLEIFVIDHDAELEVIVEKITMHYKNKSCC